MFRFVRTFIGNADDAEDITQETFIAAIDSLRRLRGATSLQPYLLGIAVRLANSGRRRRARRERLAPTDAAYADTLVYHPAFRLNKPRLCATLCGDSRTPTAPRFCWSRKRVFRNARRRLLCRSRSA